MGRLRSWWQYIRKHWIVAIIITLAMAFIFIESLINGTGFNGYYATSTTHTIRGSLPTITSTEIYQPGKTLWDWLQLLFIPVVLAVAGFWFNHRERKAAERRAEAEKEIEQQRAKAEQEIASDNQREAALQAYIDKLSELLLVNDLRGSTEDKEVQKIARVRTLTVLRRLDAERKGSVLRFLHESGLICIDKRIIDLSSADLRLAKLIVADLRGADLRVADLSGVDLRGADLRGAKLIGADLGFADLRGTDLSGADLFGANLGFAFMGGAKLSNASLRGANLSGADLSGAKLSGAIDISNEKLEKEAKSLKGATMPDGSIHP